MSLMPPTKALTLIIEERTRQIKVKGYTPAHDDQHTEGQLALLAAAYALNSIDRVVSPKMHIHILATDAIDNFLEDYGLDHNFKPKSPISDLTRAGALILAELERRLRAEEKE